MFLKLPKNNERIYWTKHSKSKMRQYQLSEKRVLRILRRPYRREEGIMPGAIAHMQITGTKKNPTEAWLMYLLLKKPPHQNPDTTTSLSTGHSKFGTGQAKGIKIISAWRYPGRTPKDQRPLIPEDILQDLLKEGII